MTIFDIDSSMLECIDKETGEVIDTEKLEALQMEREKKIENVACWIKNLKAEAEAIKNEKLVLAERQRITENKAESLKNYLEYVLNGQKFSTGKVNISYRKSVSVEVSDVKILQIAGYDEFLKFEDPKPDKAKIKEFLKNNDEQIPGVTLIEKTSIQIK